MITIPASDLRQRVQEIFSAVGSPEAISRRVAEALVDSNLVGHDSHGVIRVPAYVDSIRSGRILPAGEPKVARDLPAAALVDCGWTFGQVAAAWGMELAMSKARQMGIGMAALFHCNHIGRLGEYVTMAAEQGLMGMVYCNGSAPGGIVAPFWRHRSRARRQSPRMGRARTER